MRVKNRKPVLWNLMSLPWTERDADSELPLVAMMLHYVIDTPQKGLGKLRTTRARKSDGSMQSHTCGWENASLETENFVKAVHPNFYPFAFAKGDSPSSTFSKADLETVMDSWTENVLKPMHEISNVKIAFFGCHNELLHQKGHEQLGFAPRIPQEG